MISSSDLTHVSTCIRPATERLLRVFPAIGSAKHSFQEGLSNDFYELILFHMLLSLYSILSEHIVLPSSDEQFSWRWAGVFLIFYLLFNIIQLKLLYYYFHFNTAWIPSSSPVLFCPHNALTKRVCLSLKSSGKPSQLFPQISLNDLFCSLGHAHQLLRTQAL